MAKPRTRSDINRESRNKRPDAKNAHAPKGKHWCYYHHDGEGAYLLKRNFNKNSSKVSGLDNKCRDCAKAYRLEMEAKHGKRHDATATVRLPRGAHKQIKDLAARAGDSMGGYMITAVRFYLRYGCQHPRCSKPASRYGKCDEHILAVVETREERAS